jgi:hypothetical protein
MALLLQILRRKRQYEKTLKILNDRKNDKHFIFATSNADIPYETLLKP